MFAFFGCCYQLKHRQLWIKNRLSTFLTDSNQVPERVILRGETIMKWNFLITQDKINVQVDFT
jgi:uncharacterized membrane protein